MVQINPKVPTSRLHDCPFPLIGLTGGIATGKSTVSDLLKRSQIPVICADNLIHQIYSEKKVREFIEKEVPSAVTDGSIHFPTLRESFFKSPQLKKELEELLYSFLPEYFHRSLPKQAAFVFYDVPLLFEKKMESHFDLVVSVLCSQETQRKRVLKRDAETNQETLENILKSQLPLETKQKSSDFVIENEGTLEELELKVKELLSELSKHY